MQTTPNYYAVITADVRYDKELADSEKLLFAELSALSNKYGYCTAGNAFFAELYGVSERTISRRISHLADKQYISIELERVGSVVKHRKIYIQDSATRAAVTEDNIDNAKNDNANSDVGTEDNLVIPTEDKSDVYNNTSVFNTTSVNQLKPTNKPTTVVSGLVSKGYAQLTQFYEQNIRPVTPYLAEELGHLLDDYVDAELITEALKLAVQKNAGNALKFAQGVLRNWRNDNVTTYQQWQNKQLREAKNYAENERPTQRGFKRYDGQGTSTPTIFGNYCSTPN